MAGQLPPPSKALQDFSAEPNAQSETSDVAAPSPALSQFVSDDVYGTPGQQALAGVEGVARGVTLGGSDFAETRLGLSTPEAIEGRRSANPVTSIGGNVLGGAALVGATGGLAAPVEALGLGAEAVEAGSAAAEAAKAAGATASQISKAARLASSASAGALRATGARALGYGAEGAVFGAGNAVSDAALGDPDLNAQKVLAHIGMGAALGSGLGLLSKGIEAIPALRRGGGEAAAEAEAAGEIPPVVDAPMTGVQPTSFEEMAKRVDDAVKYGNQTVELPQKAVLEDATSRIEMANPVHPLQLQSLDNQEAKNLYNVARDLPGKEGEAIRNYEALQKSELVSKTDKTIENVAPGFRPTPDATKGGEQSIQAFTEQYQAEKKALQPIFESLKETDLGTVDHLPGVIEKFTDAVPGVSRMFDTEAGDFAIHPYKTTWGIDKATYDAVKEAVTALKEVPEGFEDLANIRRGLDQHVDILAQGQAPQQIRALKAAMMDYIQSAVQEANPSLEVREAFKRWAINEQERGAIEKVFGASVGSPEFGAVSKIKPEVIGDRIFSNTANVKAAKAILPAEKFNQILANWLSEAREAATDKGVFSANKFAGFLRKNQDSLNEAFRDAPGVLQRLKDIATISRILPDAASINPSGTAKTLLGAFHGAHDLYGLVKNIAGFAANKFQDAQVRVEVSAALAGKADQAAKLHSIEGIVEKIGNKINAGAKAVFNSPSGRAGAAAGAAAMSNSEFEKNAARVKEMTTNPHAMLEHLGSSTDALYAAAPNITQGIHNSMMSAVQFLNSKLPRPSDHMTLSPEWKPSKSQRYTFDNYFRTVNDPISILDDVKNQSVTNESLEALQVVHPHLLQEMRAKVIANLKPEKAKELPYAAKLSLSKFLGEPLDQNMLPQSILSSQAAFNSPQLSKQSAPQDGQKVTLGGMKQLNLASRTATQTRRLDDQS